MELWGDAAVSPLGWYREVTPWWHSGDGAVGRCCGVTAGMAQGGDTVVAQWGWGCGAMLRCHHGDGTGR